MPWPSGPVVASTPVSLERFRMPRRVAVELPELLDLLQGQIEARQVQPR